MDKRKKILLIVIAMIYLAFFTSYLYLPESAILLYSELNQEYALSTGKSITIINWTYSAGQDQMEVEISVNDSSFENEDFEYYITSKSSQFAQRKEISYSLVVDNSFYKVFHLSDVDEDFREISFSIMSKSEDSEIRLYTNINDVQRVENIKALTYEDYQRQRLNNLSLTKENEVLKYTNSISELNTKIINITKKNRELEDQKSFSTRTEIYEIDQEIANNQRLLAETENQISEIEILILQIESEIEEIKETLNK